jgi:uncharacterized protein (UPF0297 family)
VKGGIAVSNFTDTTKLQPIRDSRSTAKDILEHVYRALQAKGYDPITQITGFILTGDPTYITSYNNARSLICRLDRDELLQELLKTYLDK